MKLKCRVIRVVSLLGVVICFGISCGKDDADRADYKSKHAINNMVPTAKVRLAGEEPVQTQTTVEGWSCVLSIENRITNTSQSSPVCRIIVKNESTNTLTCWSGLYCETYSRIQLTDANGVTVEFTSSGGQIGTRTSEDQTKAMVKKRFQHWMEGQTTTAGFISVPPGQNYGVGFSLPELFAVSKSGVYVLKVQTCLIQKVGGQSSDPNLKIVWFPQMTAKLDMVVK